MENIMIYFINGFIALFYWIITYAWQAVMFVLMVILLIIDYKEKTNVLYIDDKRKVI